MPAEITMPQLSDTMTEGTLIKWNKKEGDKVKAGEEVADVETDKATMPLESYDGGTIAYIAVQEGGKVAVGSLVAVIAKGSENPAEIKAKYAAGGNAKPAAPAAAPLARAAESAPAAQPDKVTATATLVAASRGEIHEPDGVGHGATREASHPVPPLPQAKGNGESHRVRVSPLAKRIATENKLDLSRVPGSGPEGRIVQRDVLSYLENGGGKESAASAPAATPVVLSGEKQVITLTKMRTAIAAALLRSKQTVPHFYETIDIDVTDLSQLRERLNKRLEKEKVRLSLADFITKAVASTLIQHPALNARFNSEKGEITRYGDVNLGIAVSVPDGLIVPVLRGVNLLGLKEIRARSEDLIKRGRDQRLKREEMSEATFTISSLGTFGIRDFSAIINPPEVGILAVGAAEKRAVVKGDAIVIRTMMSVTLSCDHRVVDGATAADFLRSLKETLEEPGMLLV